MVPKGWEKRDLRNLVTIKHGFAFKSEFFTEDGESFGNPAVRFA